MSDNKIDISTDYVSAILILFWVFWWQSGWYRIDCALGQTAACDLITAEYKAEAIKAAAKGGSQP